MTLGACDRHMSWVMPGVMPGEGFPVTNFTNIWKGEGKGEYAIYSTTYISFVLDCINVVSDSTTVVLVFHKRLHPVEITGCDRCQYTKYHLKMGNLHLIYLRK